MEIRRPVRSRGKNKIAPVRLIVGSFLVIILLGTLLLTLPVSTRTGKRTDFLDALFTATSAACVTGLSPFSTGPYWSGFGQAVLLALIQIGGLGAMTIILGLVSLVTGRVSLQNTRVLMQAAGNDRFSGIRPLIRRMFLGTALCEGAGTLLLATRFIPAFGWGKGIWFSVFHSVSAFCNAGFDLLGDYRGGASLSAFALDPVVNLTVMLLIIVGGLGFVVWSDLLDCKFRLRNLKFHTRLVLVTTAALLVGSFALFFVLEYNHAFKGYTVPEKLLLSLFQAVTPRTAGFATVDMAKLSDSGAVFTMILMFIGGSPGSTAGGIKTTTLAVLLLSTGAAALKRTPAAFKRRIDDETVRQAGAILTIYMTATLTATMIISAVEALPLRETLFEVVSAIGTVGLSMNVTPTLSYVAKFILTVFMFAGRIGGLSAAFALAAGKNPSPVSYPVGKVLIG